MNMYKFHITGYTGNCKNDYQYNSKSPVSATVVAETLNEAIDKVEKALGLYISIAYRQIDIEEVDVSGKIEELREEIRELEHKKWATEMISTLFTHPGDKKD